MATSEQQNLDTIISLWICSILTLLVLLTRIFLRIIKKRQAMTDDYWIVFSVPLLISRCLVMHYALVYGSNNIASTKGLDANDIKRRELGSKLTLSARVFYGGFVWVMKLCMVYFYQRLTKRVPGFKITLLLVKIFLGITLVGVIISTFAECRPFNHYWQVVPSPAVACKQAQAQLLTMGICNIFTDVILLAIPVPIIWTSQLPLKRKLQLASLFAIGIFVIIITIMKMPIIVKDANIIKERALWASLEMLACCIVVNAPVLITYIKTQKRDTSLQYLSGSRTASSRSRSISTGNNPKQKFTQQSIMVDTVYDPKERVVIETTQEISQMVNSQSDLEKGNASRQASNGDLKGSETIVTNIWTDRGSGASHSPSDSTTSLTISRSP